MVCYGNLLTYYINTDHAYLFKILKKNLKTFFFQSILIGTIYRLHYIVFIKWN